MEADGLGLGLSGDELRDVFEALGRLYLRQCATDDYLPHVGREEGRTGPERKLSGHGPPSGQKMNPIIPRVRPKAGPGSDR